MANPSPATAQELTYLRSEKQFTELFLAVRKPSTIYAAQLDGAPSGDNASFPYDMVAQISYTSGSGTLGNVLIGMTIWFGTEAGLSDCGMSYVRQDPTADTFYLGEESDIDWDNVVHITVVDDYGLWARHIKIISDEAYVDYNVDYTDQHTDFDPIVMMGDDVVLWRTGATVTLERDASGSSVFDSTITGYQWACPGALSVTNDTTATPTITFDADGQFPLYCEVTAATGKTWTGVRIVYVFSSSSLPITTFKLENCSLDWSDGGVSFEVELGDNVSLTDIPPKAKVVLFARDHYDGTIISMGASSGSENIVANGWIDDEQIEINPDEGTARLRIYGAQEWFKRIPAFPVGLRSTIGAPTKWTQMLGLTVDRAVWHLLHWRSTASRIMDMNLTDDTRYASEIIGPATSLWMQLEEVGKLTILATCGIDQFGTFNIEVEPQLVPDADRAAWPVIQAITDADIDGSYSLKHAPIPSVSMVYLSGVNVNSGGGLENTFFSLATGHVYLHYGSPEILEKLLLETQADSNTLCAAYMGWKNSTVPSVAIKFYGIHRLCTLWPYQLFTINILSSSNERAFSYSGNLIPRRVEYEHDEETGEFFTEITFETETTPTLSTNGDIPISSGVAWSIPESPSFTGLPPMPSLESYPEYQPIPTGAGLYEPEKVLVHILGKGLFISSNFDEDYPNWTAWNSGLPSAYVTDGTGINQITVSKWSYKAYCWYGSTAYYSSGWGNAWTQFIDAAWVAANSIPPLGGPFPYPRDYRIHGVALNEYSDNEVLVMLGFTSSIYSNKHARVWHGWNVDGNTANLTGQSYLANVGFDCYPDNVTIRFGGGEWVVWGNTLYRLEQGGAALTATNAYGSVNWSTSLAKGGQGRYTALTRPGYVRFTDDNFATAPSAITFGVYGLAYYNFQPYAMSLSGIRQCAVDASNIFQISSNSGGSWSSPAGFPTGAYCVANQHGDDNRFICQAGSQILYTDDFWSTWKDKTGDLLSQTGGVSTARAIRIVSDFGI